MKKVFSVILVLLCAAVLFAADVAFKVRMCPIVDKDGFRMELGVLQADYSVSGDRAGASAKICYNFASSQQKNGFILGGEIWYKQNDQTKIAMGMQTQMAYNEGIIPALTFCYGRLNYDAPRLDESFNPLDGNAFQMELEFGSIITSDFNFKNNRYYCSGEFDFLYSEKWESLIGHFDAKSLFSFNDGAVNAEMLFAELSYAPSSIYRIRKCDISFSGGEWGYNYYDGSILGDCNNADWTDKTTNFIVSDQKLLRASLTYEYSLKNKDEDNGFFANVWAKNIPLKGEFEKTNTEGSFVTVKAKAGLKKSTLELGYHYSAEEDRLVDAAANVQAEFYYYDGFDYAIPYAIAEVYTPTDTTFGNIRAYAEYINSADDPSANGVYLNAETNGSIGICGISLNMRAGFDFNGLKDDYRAVGSFTVNF